MADEQSSSVVTLITTTLISNHRVLELIRQFPFQRPLDTNELREAVYLGYLPWASRYPDHIFDNGWAHLTRGSARHPSGGGLLSAALGEMAEEFLAVAHGELRVKKEKFGAWQQSVLSRVCGTPVIAAAHCRNPHWNRHDDRRAKWATSLVPILHPHDALVDDYVTREGLHETHLHLNGTTQAELCWMRALRKPKAETQDFNAKWMAKNTHDATKIRELARAINPTLAPVELYRQLCIARNLRTVLTGLAKGAIKDTAELPSRYEQFIQNLSPELSSHLDFELTGKSKVEDETLWMTLILARLEREPNVTIERMLHCYLLLQNHYYRLLVQSEEQFGFDQFQKFTLTDLREPEEKSYLNRFLAMHGPYSQVSRVGYLEGRFAPKANLEKNRNLLQAILLGYWQYLVEVSGEGTSPRPRFLRETLEFLEKKIKTFSSLDRRYQRLALVAHFPKKPWSAEPRHKAGPYRFFRQRAEIQRSTNALLQTLNKWPLLDMWLRGIDAAANELHAPPEVFASYFRVCQAAGLSRRSYHVGEDYLHLLSGIRHMLDALRLLDLQNGDRIGHGTAMGIDPQLWLDRVPQQLLVKRGEWMLDLLAAWQLLRDIPGENQVANQAQHQLAMLASQIFGRDISCTALERTMTLRDLHIGYLQASYRPSWRWQSASLNDHWQAEARRVHEAKTTSGADVDLLWEWHSDRSIWKKSEELIQVDAAYFPAAIYVRIQQALMNEVVRRSVIIETLPSSNVRISHYHQFSEHHSLRWMRVPGFVKEGDPHIMVSLGSDDPGIFAGDLHSEFYQLYSALRNQRISDSEALGYLSVVNERGRKYRFHHPSLG